MPPPNFMPTVDALKVIACTRTTGDPVTVVDDISGHGEYNAHERSLADAARSKEHSRSYPAAPSAVPEPQQR